MLPEAKALFFALAVIASSLVTIECISFDRRIRCNNSPIICEWSCAHGSNTGGSCLQTSPGRRECFCYEESVQRTICDGYVDAEAAGGTCRKFCQSIGRLEGFCESETKDCICSESRIPHFGDSLCVTNEVCSTFCRTYRGLPGGLCRQMGTYKECQCAQRILDIAIP